MTVLVFRHVPFEDLGRIGPALEARGLETRYVDWYASPQAVARWEEAAGLIFLGGPMSANDELEYLRREMALIEAAWRASKPVLGICLGAQLIAKAAGARVYRNPVKEIGWGPLYFTEAAARDPLFAGLTGPEVVFHWHAETFDLPAGAEHLAWTPACPNQAFRLDASVWGLQFHLEVTPAMIADWCQAPENSEDLSELPAPPDPWENAARLEELAAVVFGRWAELAHSAGQTAGR